MISGDVLVGTNRALGLSFYTGVPCSFLEPMMKRVAAEPGARYVAATHEGEALAIAAGAWLAGRPSAALCQNSGLGNMVNPLTTLCHPFRIPVLLFVTWRGEPGINDEPQHELTGRITRGLLDLMEVPNEILADSDAGVAEVLRVAEHRMRETRRPHAFVVKGHSIADGPEAPPADIDPPAVAGPAEVVVLAAGGPRPDRYAAMEGILETLPARAAVIATTGKCARELFTIGDRDAYFYQVGSMGHASALGLGVALNWSGLTVVLDGDGAALMKLGTMATVGACRPRNLLHIVLDNGTYDSTGGQPSASANTDFAAVAAACGYGAAFACDDLAGLHAALDLALAGGGPTLIHMKIAPGSRSPLGRPTIHPEDVAARFREYLVGDRGNAPFAT